MNDTLYLINGSWLTYEEAHNLGYTLQKPNILTFYSTDLVETPVIQDTSDNTFYDSANQQWVSDIDDLNLYKLVGDLIMFDGEIQHTFVAYSSSAFSDEASHVYINNSFASIEDLHNSGGYTLNQCVDYIVDEGERLVWYDPNTELYWDNRDGRKLWVDTPPVISKSELQDVFIMPSTCEAYLLPQWEDDLSQMPMRYCVSAFDEQDLQIDSQKPMLTGFPIAFDYDNVNPLMLTAYADITELDKTFYVFPDKGVADYTGKHHEQGDTFTGDYRYVWVDSDQDVVFYKAQQQYVLGQSHDEKYFELYWCEDKYRTYQEVLNLGYSPTPSDIGLKAADTNVEFEIDDIYDVMENKSLGYYCNGGWYQTIADLNNAGYYLVEKVTEHVYLNSSSTYKYFEPSIIKTSVSFNTSNYRYACRDFNNTSDFLWDGHNWFFDPEESFAITVVTDNNFKHKNGYKYVSRLLDMPSSTSASQMHLIVPITASGTPLNKFIQSELNTQLYLYFCANNTSSESLYYGDCMSAAISYWKLI